MSDCPRHPDGDGPYWCQDCHGIHDIRPGREHTGAGDTEHDAAKVPRGPQRKKVLAEFRRRGRDGLTDYEMNEILVPGRRSVSAGTRRAELIRDGWPIRDSGRRRATDTGAMAIVWVLDGELEPQRPNLMLVT